jgi:hypothetical protein
LRGLRLVWHTGPVLCNDCATDLRAAYAILEEILKVKERKINELHATVIQQRAEIIQWIEPGMLEPSSSMSKGPSSPRRAKKSCGSITSSRRHMTRFTQGGTDPADDDVISVLMAKILEEALS